MENKINENIDEILRLLKRHNDSHVIGSFDTIFLYSLSIVSFLAGIIVSRMEEWGMTSWYLLLLILIFYLVGAVGGLYSILKGDLNLRLFFWKLSINLALLISIPFITVIGFLVLVVKFITIELSADILLLLIVIGFLLWIILTPILTDSLFSRLKSLLKDRLRVRWNDFGQHRRSSINEYILPEFDRKQGFKRSLIYSLLPFIALISLFTLIHYNILISFVYSYVSYVIILELILISKRINRIYTTINRIKRRIDDLFKLV